MWDGDRECDFGVLGLVLRRRDLCYVDPARVTWAHSMILEELGIVMKMKGKSRTSCDFL